MTINEDFPFHAKRKVLEAAFNSAILYGSEAWVNCSLAPIKGLYMSAIKVVLGVRQTTPNDIALVEIGMPSLEALVLKKQENFFCKILEERQDLYDDPFMHVFRMIADSALGRHIKNVALGRQTAKHNPVENIRTATGSKLTLYRKINPRLEAPSIYTTYQPHVHEHLRVSYTRIRTSSHRLRVETGRWARIAREDRLCICGEDIQDEKHVLQFCNAVDHLRPEDGVVFPLCLQENIPFQMIHDILEFYQ